MIRFSYLLAIALAAGVGYYMLTGVAVIGGQPENHPAPIAERTETAGTALFAVQVEPHQAKTRTTHLEIRGRTEADAKVSVRAQTSGVVEERHIAKGQSVAAGDLLCVIERGARQADLARAQAQLIQAQTDLDARTGLAGKGFVAKNQIPVLQAAVDAAKAALASAEWELDRTEVKAPVSGVVQDPIAELGDMLQPGDICATLIDNDPMKIIGQVPERDIALLSTGMSADVELVGGKTVTGTITYIAPSSDAQTRTFQVEIDFANPDKSVRDGITAVAKVPLEPSSAHLISSAYLTLNDAGSVGVRTVDDSDVVSFAPVKILGGAAEGLWVAGLPEKVSIITVGQDYVREGQTVKPVPATASAAMQPKRTAELDQ